MTVQQHHIATQDQQQQQLQEGAMTKASCNSQSSSELSVPEALAQMQQAVRRGEMQQAAAIGATAVVPLSIRLEDLNLLGEIASGAEATVLYGSLNNVTDVAVKRFKMHQADDLTRFRRELTILAQLSQHPNIVPLLGARALPPDYVMVMPLAAATLHSKLYQLGWRPSVVELLSLALQAAEGLAAVHAAGLVHRDIKPSNMLLSEEGRLWLSDFGLAAPMDEVVRQSTLSVGMVRSRGKPTGGFLKRAMAGTLEYMAPEVLQKQPASPASDVYALAITINELATGVYPFSDCTKDNPDIHTVLEHGYGRQELATAVAAEGLRPSLPRSDAAVPAGLVELFQSAWNLNPAARPTVQQFRDRLAVLLEQAVQHQGSSEPAAAAAAAVAPMEIDLGAVSNTVMSRTRFDQSAGCSSPRSACGSDIVSLADTASEAGTAAGVAAAAAAGGGGSGGCGSSSCSSSGVFSSGVFSRSSSYHSLLGLAGGVGGNGSSSAGGGGGGGSSSSSSTSVRKGRLPRASSGSLSTLSMEFPGWTANNSSSSSSSMLAGLAAAKPLSTEAANAAAAAAAAAAVPAAAASQHSVLSQVAAAAAAAAAAEQQPAVVVEAGAFGALGPREAMEDRHVVVQGLGGDAKVTLAAVFDGHRGHEAAAYAAAQLPRNLLIAAVDVGMRENSGSSGGSSSSSDDSRTAAPAAAAASAAGPEPAADGSSGPAAALKQSFISTDASFWQEWQAETHTSAVMGLYAERYPGCTALAAVVAAQQLYVANAGDGRAVLSRGGTAVPLSRQHTADLADERARVVAAGGTVMCRGGSWRVGPAALQVTRALGDFDLKQPGQQPGQQQQQYSRLPGQQQQQQQQPLAGPACLLGCRSPYHQLPQQQAGTSSDGDAGSSSSSSPALPVTAEPEVVSVQLQACDQFLILGTDGLWDVMNDQEAVGLVNDTVKDPGLCAKRLVQEALARGSNDNVTAVVVFLRPKSTLESVWKGSSGAAVPAAQPTFYGTRRPTTPQLTAAVQQQEGGSRTTTGVGAGAVSAQGVADELMDTY